MSESTTTKSLLDVAISQATFIRATPEHVYTLLTTGEGWDAWFTSGAKVEPWPGGEIRFRWRNWGPDHIDADDFGAVVEAQEPRRFAFRWHPDGPDYATTVEIDLEPSGEGTVARLRESGYCNTASGIQSMVGCATGWGEAMTLLKFYVEHGIHIKNDN